MSNPEQLELDLNNDGTAATSKPTPITGYRALTEGELHLINEIKAISNEVGRLVEGMAMNGKLDTRWVAIARTDLQKGFMALVRAVAQPTSF
jgi:hypothetical protein